jgi:hypothetical protein
MFPLILTLRMKVQYFSDTLDSVGLIAAPPSFDSYKNSGFPPSRATCQCKYTCYKKLIQQASPFLDQSAS